MISYKDSALASDSSWTKVTPSVAAAAVLGIVSHKIYQRSEPTLYRFIGNTILLAGIFYSSVQHGLVPDLLEHTSGGQTNWCLLQTLKYTFIYLASLLASLLYYRIGPSHPLSGIPGPFAAKISQAWLFSKVLHGQTRHDMRAVHAKYGDYVRIGPNEVSVSNADEFLAVHGAKSWIKGASYLQSASGNAQAPETSLIAIRDHNDHANRRKVWDKAFSMQSLKDYQGVLETRVIQLLDKLNGFSREKTAVDLHDWLGYFVWDVMTDLAYSGGGKMLEAGKDVEGSLEALCSSLHYAGLLKVMPWMSPIIERLSWYPERKTFRRLATNLFRKRLEQGAETKHHDVFYHLLGEGSDDGKTLNEAALAADSALVIAAGADTTRLVLTTLFVYMLRHPERYRELQQELDKQLHASAMVASVEELKQIPLLEAFINEALRLNPPVPFANQREAPAEGQVFGKYHIPAKTQVRFACYTIHRDPRYFENPESFNPSRWLTSASDPKCNRKAFFPFLAGAYHCVGKQFALQEMRMIVATIVHNYDMSPAADFNATEWEEAIQDRALVEIHKPLNVHLTARW